MRERQVHPQSKLSHYRNVSDLVSDLPKMACPAIVSDLCPTERGSVRDSVRIVSDREAPVGRTPTPPYRGVSDRTTGRPARRRYCLVCCSPIRHGPAATLNGYTPHPYDPGERRRNLRTVVTR